MIKIEPYKKPEKKEYVNFRLRKMIYNFFLDNQEKMYSMTPEEKARFVSQEVEKLTVENYWIKDKRKDCVHVQLNKKAA